MSSSIKISIVIPSYNQGQFIEQTIESVLSQDYPNKELIIIDGGSEDDSVTIIKKYEKHLKFWTSEPDNGQAHAINKGLAHVTREIFNWINSDDYLESGALSNVAKAFEKKSETQVVCGYTRCFYEQSGETRHTYRMGLKKDATTTLLNIEMNQPGTFYRTDVVKKLGGVNETLQYVMDDELWMRYLCTNGQKNVLLIDDLLAHFRLHNDSKSLGDGFAPFLEERQTIMNHLCTLTNMPDYLLDCLPKQELQRYAPPGEWSLDALDIRKFHSWFDNKYLVTLLNKGAIQEARNSLMASLKNRQFQWNRKNVGVLRKILFA